MPHYQRRKNDDSRRRAMFIRVLNRHGILPGSFVHLARIKALHDSEKANTVKPRRSRFRA